MAVTSIRSLGSRAMRIEIERESGLADDRALLPCIRKAPRRDIRCRRVRRTAIPGPLITPKVGLQTRHRREAYCYQQIPARHGRRLRKIIGVRKSRLSQIVRDISQSDDGAPVADESPDIDS